jgi:hypothetical protein
MEEAKDWNEFLEARAIVKTLRTLLDFEQVMKTRLDEVRINQEENEHGSREH